MIGSFYFPSSFPPLRWSIVRSFARHKEFLWQFCNWGSAPLLGRKTHGRVPGLAGICAAARSQLAQAGAAAGHGGDRGGYQLGHEIGGHSGRFCFLEGAARPKAAAQGATTTIGGAPPAKWKPGLPPGASAACAFCITTPARRRESPVRDPQLDVPSRARRTTKGHGPGAGGACA